MNHRANKETVELDSNLKPLDLFLKRTHYRFGHNQGCKKIFDGKGLNSTDPQTIPYFKHVHLSNLPGLLEQKFT